jgi:hypothetical protein
MACEKVMKPGLPRTWIEREKAASEQLWQVTDLPYCASVGDKWGRSVTCRFSGPAEPRPEGVNMDLRPTNGDEKHAERRMPGEGSAGPDLFFRGAVRT